MGRASTKEDKNIYFTRREELGWTRLQASNNMNNRLSADQIERIENDRALPQPDDVLTMAEYYKDPYLCNYYCAKQCPIGQKTVTEVKVKELSQIVLDILHSTNTIKQKQDELIAITADGKISNDEVAEFARIQDDLDHIADMVEALQLWSEQMLASGAIDKDTYKHYRQ